MNEVSGRSRIAMLVIAASIAMIFIVGWAFLLYRFHKSLHEVDRKLADEIGEPSLFWTAFNGHVGLIRVIANRGIGQSRHAPLRSQARVLRVWAFLLLASLGWVAWELAQVPAP